MRSHSKAWRWTKRILLGVGAFLVVVVAAALIVIHTDYGRELIRKQVQASLNDTFTGGATLGKVEGSPFSELRLKDLVINGPDGKPAITVGTLKLELGLLPLISHQARLSGLIAEDVDVILKKDQSGGYQIAHLTKPGPKSAWSIDMPKIAVHRGHVAIEGNGEWTNLDGIDIFGAAHMPNGKPLKANIAINALWRERAAAVALQSVLISSPEGITEIPSLTAQVGSVTVAAAGVKIVTSTTGKPPVIDGSVFVRAPRAGVMQLLPTVDLPADINVAVNAWSAMPWTEMSIVGMLGATPIRASISADLEHKHARGWVSSGALDMGALTKGKLLGTAGGIAIFDATQGKPGELPSASGMVNAWSQLQDAPNSHLAIAFNTNGDKASTVIGATAPGLSATVSAAVIKVGDVITLERSTVLANTKDPAKATGGKAPVHGSLHVDLAASGALVPNPNLKLVGKISGGHLSMKDLSVATLNLDVDATELPRQPKGHAKLQLTGIVRQQMELGKLDVDARNNDKGQIRVVVRSQPKQNPWLIDLDALITPPGKQSVTIIDIEKHHIRAGAGQNWYGNTGHIEISPAKIEVRDLESHSTGGKLAVQAVLARASGNLTAKVDATTIDLANLATTVRGSVDAHVDVSRIANRWAGDVTFSGKGIAADPSPVVFNADAKIHASADKLLVDAKADATGLGGAKIALDVDAPKNITDLAAWQRLGRDAIRNAQLTMQQVDLSKVAELAGKPGQVTGRLDGDIKISATSTGGVVQLRNVLTPTLRGTGSISADLSLSQSASDPDEIGADLNAKVDGIATVFANARVDMPDRLFDPKAWKAKGKAMIKGAVLRVENVNIDPGLLDRFNITTQLRGRASIGAEISEAARSAQIAVDVVELRGTPIAEPVELHLAAAIDGNDTNTTLAIRAQSSTLLDVRGTIPVSLDQLIKNPQAVRAMPLNVTATVPSAPASKLLAVFGRSEITGGTIKGNIKITGTVGEPKMVATLLGSGLKVPPGPNNKPVKTVELIKLDASWNGTHGKLEIHGKEQAGTLDLVAQGSPADLAAATVTLKAKQFDLIPLLAFAPGPAGGAKGRLDADLSMEGLDLRTSKIAGELHITDGRVPVAPAVGTLRKAQIDLVFKDHMLNVNVDGKMGPGTVKVVGQVGIDGAAISQGNARITLRDVTPIGSVEPKINADIVAKLNRQDAKWIGDVTIEHANIDIPDNRSGEKLKPVGAPSDMVFATTGERMTSRPMVKEPPKAPSIEINIHLASTHVKSKEFQGYLRGNLKIVADTNAVGIFGDIETQRGDLDLFDRRYQVERAAVHFDGSPDPLLDVRITHDFPDVTTITEVRGRASKPELVLSSSTGAYSQGQLLGFLLGGEPDNGDANASAKDKATAAGESFVANKIGGYVKSALPVDLDVLRYEAAGANSSAAIIVGTWLTSSLFLSYKQHLGARPDENTGEGQVEYYLTKRVMVQGTAGDRNIDGVDLLWRKRY